MDGYHPMSEKAGSKISCQDGALPKGYGVENKLDLWITSISAKTAWATPRLAKIRLRSWAFQAVERLLLGRGEEAG